MQMLVLVIFQREQFVCFSQGGDLAPQHFDPCAGVPDSSTEQSSFLSEASRQRRFVWAPSHARRVRTCGHNTPTPYIPPPCPTRVL